MKSHERLIESVKQWPRRLGKAYLLDYLEGESITLIQAVYAKCYECNVGEGEPCTMTSCPLLPYSQFKQDEMKKRKKK